MPQPEISTTLILPEPRDQQEIDLYKSLQDFATLIIRALIESEVDFIAGDYIISEANTEASEATATFTKEKEFYVGRSGEIRVNCEIKTDDVTNTRQAEARVYRNGSYITGEEFTTTSDSYVAKTSDISGWAEGDLCQIYLRIDDVTGGKTASIQNANISVSNPSDSARHKDYS